jgi:hypothetical protein
MFVVALCLTFPAARRLPLQSFVLTDLCDSWILNAECWILKNSESAFLVTSLIADTECFGNDVSDQNTRSLSLLVVQHIGYRDFKGWQRLSPLDFPNICGLRSVAQRTKRFA